MDALAAAKNFFIGEPLTAVPMGNGRVNETFSVEAERGKFTLQRINGNVFGHIPEMTENIVKVSSHILKKRYTVSPVAAKSGGYLYKEGEIFWRMFDYAEGKVVERAESPSDAYLVGLGFGGFQNALSDFDEPLFETIPNFHDTPDRLKKFRYALKTASPERIKSAEKLIEGYLSHEKLAPVITESLRAGKIPQRVTHNDTKINNIVLSRDGKRVVCVIDLDTVMNGSLLYDFGDMTRSCCNPGGEEGEFGAVGFDAEFYEALVSGFAEGVGASLTESEILSAPISGAVLTFECGLRFLTDYLSGDVYFKTNYSGQNKVRAEVHLSYLEDIMKNLSKMEGICNAIFR